MFNFWFKKTEKLKIPQISVLFCKQECLNQKKSTTQKIYNFENFGAKLFTKM